MQRIPTTAAPPPRRSRSAGDRATPRTPAPFRQARAPAGTPGALGPAALTAIQRLAGNRAAVSLLAAAPVPAVQRRPRDRTGRPKLTGRVVLNGTTPHHTAVQVTTTKELIPPWEDPAGWRGFPDEPTALVTATRHAAEQGRVTVVMRRSGAFHAVATDTASIEALKLQVSTPSGAVDRFVEPPTAPSSAGTWSDRVRRAAGARTTKQRARAYADLLAEATGVPASEIHICWKDAAGDEGPPDAKPGVLNFALRKTDAQATTYPSGLRAERTGTLPVPAVVLGPRAFDGGSPEFIRSTMIHEQRHAFHMREIVGHIRQWREARTRRAFLPWLKRRRSVPDEIQWVAKTLVQHRVQGGTTEYSVEVTELFAHLEALRAELFHLSAKELTSSARLSVLGRLKSLTRYYINAEIDAPKPEIIRRLAGDLAKLDADRRTAFSTLVADLPAALASDRLFAKSRHRWEPFVAELETISKRALRDAP